MNDEHRAGPVQEDDWRRAWQEHAPAAAEAERTARTIMARVWRFDHTIAWRNAREYAAGLLVIVVYAMQAALGHSTLMNAIGIGCVGFVLVYLWWRHRGMQPLDPAADAASYRAALLRRFDDQIALLRTMPYWYLLPLTVPTVGLILTGWPRVGWLVLVPLAIVAALFGFVAWLNVIVTVRWLRAQRQQAESMFPAE